MTKLFPVLLTDKDRDRPGVLVEVPWALVEPCRRRAWFNHEQALEGLARRGGLSPCELVAVLEDRPWRPMADTDAAVARLRVIAAERGVDL